MKMIKTTGLMLLAVCAMSAVTASAATALEFSPAKTKTTAESTNGKFVAPNKGVVECELTVANGETGAAGSNVITASTENKYEKCTAFGVKATVIETCKEKKFGQITGSSEEKEKKVVLLATVLLPASCEVVVSTSTCKLTAAGKQELAGTWENGVAKTSASKFTIKGAPVNVTSSGGICGASGAGTESATFSVFVTGSPKEPILLK